jgi:hypothetical protein
MASDQENAPPTLEVLKVDTISVSNGILSVPLRVYVRGSVAPEGDVVLILQAELGQDLLGKLQARVPQAIRQSQGRP